MCRKIILPHRAGFVNILFECVTEIRRTSISQHFCLAAGWHKPSLWFSTAVGALRCACRQGIISKICCFSPAGGALRCAWRQRIISKICCFSPAGGALRFPLVRKSNQKGTTKSTYGSLSYHSLMPTPCQYNKHKRLFYPLLQSTCKPASIAYGNIPKTIFVCR